ncbi:flippase [Halorussus marinus]|uniref:flippase n=1 Tax=Halorussus marinus TaxID=2505976 RepID=UPI00106DDE6F|nr:flippase [Halorussus marinus]
MDLGHSTFRLFLSKGGNAILYFLGLAYFSRHLTPDEMGAFVLFLAVLGISSIPADFGIKGALEKRLSEGTDPEKTLGSALAFKAVTLAAVATIVLAVRGHINHYIGAPLAELLVAALFFREFSFAYLSALRGRLRVAETAVIKLTVRFVWMVGGAVLVTAGFGPEGPIIGLIAGLAVGLVWAYRRLDVGIGRPSLDHVRSLVAFSKYNTVTSVGGRFYQWVDIAIIGFLLTQLDVSAYEFAWQITLLVLMLSKSISLSIFPQISQWDAESATDHIETTVSKAIGVVLFVSVPAIVGVQIYGAELLRVAFGPEYAFATTVLVVLMVEKLIQSFNDIVEASVRAIDRPELAAKATVISVGLNLVLNPVLILWVGLVGAAIATAVTGLLNTALHYRYLTRFISVDVPFRLVGWYGLASCVMGGLLLGIRHLVPVTGVITLVAEVGLGVVIYLAVSLAIPDVRRRILRPGLRVLGAQLGVGADGEGRRF